ncbi:MAG: hypothetical protein R8G33_10650 [Gammaproteobacteria bacterium]|nr:hypothetical protein [Gammaproteobacteria bacterium]
MKSLILATTLFISTLSVGQACDEMKTTQAVVDYVCDYSLVSNTQCNIWKEDMRQMNYNNRIIIDSFISWDKNKEEPNNYIAETN